MRGRTILVALVVSVGLTDCGSGAHAPAQEGSGLRLPSARVAATRFLARYVTSDGRVIRHDQGGDIVSEGQAYALLIAEIADKPGLVRTIWSWTSTHLRRPDGLFAWHATGAGQIIDPQSATDADALIAYALLRYAGPGQAELHDAGRGVAAATITNESVALPDGDPVLVAGPWAKSTSPPTVNPSYLMPGVFVALAALTGDRRWMKAARASVALMRVLTNDGQRLPPDWAQLSGSRLTPTVQPGGGAGVQYSFAAARAPIWFAAACDGAARRLAANWWRNVLGSDGRAGPAALTLTGATLGGASSPVTLLAGAAAASAADNQAAARDLRARADASSLRAPTYYGDAWAALGPALLDSVLSCPAPS